MLEIKDCGRIISELKYSKDVRKYPDNLRRGQFKAGWEDRVIRQQIYSLQALKRLTWCNLGYRMGQRFGKRSLDEINQIFDIFAEHYKITNGIVVLSWQNKIARWVAEHRKVSDTLTSDFIRFFELAFENARHPEQCWFGVHKQTVSLVIGGIFLAAVHLSSPDYGVWLLLDQDFTSDGEIEYTPVKSTRKSNTPLIWAHVKVLEKVGVLLEKPEIWQSYSEASDKILNSPISKTRDTEFQERRQKKRVSDFWKILSTSNHDMPELHIERQRMEAEGYFNVENLEDARRRVTSSIVQRQGQSEFRRKLLNAYGSKCPITGCNVEAAIEAAHIIPYLGTETNHVANGLPLRADIHTLFDLHLLSVRPDTYEIVIAPDLSETCYREFAGRKLTLPENELALPNQVALTKHYELFLQKYKVGSQDAT